MGMFGVSITCYRMELRRMSSVYAVRCLLRVYTDEADQQYCILSIVDAVSVSVELTSVEL